MVLIQDMASQLSGGTNNLCLNKGFPFSSFQSFLLEHMPSFHVSSFVRALFQSSNDIEGAGDRIWIDEDGGEIGGGRGVTGGIVVASMGAGMVDIVIEGAVFVELAATHNLSICCGAKSVCQLTSFAILPSAGMKSG